MTMTLAVPPRASSPRLAGLPIAVIGAGPVGLAAAAHLLERGHEVVVFESGDRPGSAVAEWAHVRLFSPWESLLDRASVRLLEAAGWTSPDPADSPTGAELLSRYLLPLAATPALSRCLRLNSRVTAVSRQGMDRTRSTARADTPFLLRVDDGNPTDVAARAVIDTAGTWRSPNPLSSSGLESETGTPAGVLTGLPDVLGGDRHRFAGRHTLVVGAGHSAAATLLALDRLAESAPGTRISWAIRGESAARILTGDDDQVPGRASIGRRVDALVRSGRLTLIDRFEIDTVEQLETALIGVTGVPTPGLRVHGRRAGESAAVDCDLVVNATGFRPDLAMLREIRLGLDDIVEAPRALGPLIDPNLHSCGTVPPHGVVELTHPEPGFYIAGMKSYGRAPTFLLATGYEQVRSIADELSGRHEAARTVELTLPATGVCSTSIAASAPAVPTPAVPTPAVPTPAVPTPTAPTIASTTPSTCAPGGSCCTPDDATCC
ncbi:FAD-dependent oxidoreductase [Herbiconiux daphne]|uniref:FAD-dependent oxidoreductase n=1 Tax=Herbiconiux daphne TaxID=2970914 RepID=A0ABT2GZK9_9MICO|nr:FAD-dependent oxidoreductase [Herbiconiux daphne]MCS5733397.1 FAD-dependent oxidoreductase [Herbiconiux daphne]